VFLPEIFKEGVAVERLQVAQRARAPAFQIDDWHIGYEFITAEAADEIELPGAVA
jgi:hypothetical protein